MSTISIPVGSLTESAVTILSGATVSSILSTSGMTLVGIQVPAAFTGTVITVQASDSATGSFFPVYNSAGALSYTVAPSRWLVIDPKDFIGLQFIKLVSGTAEAADRAVNLMLKGI